MGQVHDVRDFRLRRRRGSPDLRRFHRAAEENDELERLSLRPDEKIADLAREHDAVVRRVDPLIAKLGGRFAQPFVGVLQILR